MIRMLAFVMSVLLCGPILAQPAPFDMSVERPGEDRAPAQPPARPGQVDPQAGDAVAPRAAQPATFRRHIMPFSTLSLTGEVDERIWSVYLTPGQAAAGERLTFAYQNAIVVAPEASVLSVIVNGRLIGEGPVQATEAPQTRTYNLPSDLLRAGSNEIRFRVLQRHRTDCTIQSTYELWTEIPSETAFIEFAGRDAGRLSTIDDIRAVGNNGEGRTQFNIVMPALAQPSKTASLMRLAQGLALLGHMPAQSVAVTETMPALGKPGELTVLLGAASGLAPLLRSMPDGASATSVAGFVQDDATGAPLLVLTGPDWSAVEAAIEEITKITERPSDVPRDVINTERWRLPQAPLFVSDKRLRFSELGVATSEFSGRRFRTAFGIALPSDFYAGAYGEATILLDAAYTEAVRPGSRIDIYVNGSIASTVPLDSARGGFVRHLPINVTLRHFRPGSNLVELEAVLLTEADSVCAPGTSASNEARFALFDTSEFHMPDFARIGLRPNLAATSGVGYPYRADGGPVALYLDRSDSETLSAAATFVSRLALAGESLPAIERIVTPLEVGDRNALFIGALPQLPNSVLTQAGIDTSGEVAWGSASDAGSRVVTQTALDEWRARLRGGGWRTPIASIEGWMRETFDISLSSLRIAPATESAFAPPDAATLLVAQAANPSGNATWTVVTSPTPTLLKEGVSAIADLTKWNQMSGHIATFEPLNGVVNTIPAMQFEFVPTQTPSFWNYRLIGANWLSTNILLYALLLVGLAILLGLSTAGLLGKLGRRL
ncbi:cellulose biosynthesis cyclic di-GMP-binding regulatory protein BcsB [Ensifer sp. IC4062]|nr:cellulose biosynthesis cyclic di-GMP-binding regulatory protein BcsB [Ensifer sp. IC4062]